MSIELEQGGWQSLMQPTKVPLVVSVSASSGSASLYSCGIRVFGSLFRALFDTLFVRHPRSHRLRFSHFQTQISESIVRAQTT